MQAQRDCLNWATGAIADRPGPVLELGLGNGRTYDHLRERLPERDIYVLDRRIAAHPDCIPPPERMVLGEVEETLPCLARRLGAVAALIHTDLGTGDAAANAALAERLGPLLAPLLSPGGIVLANHALSVAAWRPLPLPPTVKPGRYWLYRAPEDARIPRVMPARG